MDNSPNTESGRPRTSEMGTMTMTSRIPGSNVGSNVVLPSINTILGDYFPRPHDNSSSAQTSPSMPRRFASHLPGHQTSPNPSGALPNPSTGMTTTVPLASPASKKRKTMHTPPVVPLTLTRSKPTVSETAEREYRTPVSAMGTSGSYSSGYSPYPAERDNRRSSNISSTSQPEVTSLPPVSSLSHSRASSSDSERPSLVTSLPSIFPHSHPTTPSTHSRYDTEGPLPPPESPYNQYSHNSRYGLENLQQYTPPSPPHQYYPSHSPPHHGSTYSQQYPPRMGYDSRSPNQAPPAPLRGPLDRAPYLPSSSHHHTMENGMDQFDPSAPHGTKRRRGNLPKQTTDLLRTWLNNHIQHPYPTEEEKLQLCRATGLNLNQISNWFINARRRRLPQRSDTDASMSQSRNPRSRNPTPPRPSPSMGYPSSHPPHSHSPHSHSPHSHSHDAHGILPPPVMQHNTGPYGPPGR